MRSVLWVEHAKRETDSELAADHEPPIPEGNFTARHRANHQR